MCARTTPPAAHGDGLLPIKLIALFPHYLVLVFLGIARVVVAFVAQVVVAFRGERPPRNSRVNAAFAVVVQILFIAVVIWLAITATRANDPLGWTTTAHPGQAQTYGGSDSQCDPLSSLRNGLLLPMIAATPHKVVLVFLGIGVFVIWLVVQWVIVFAGRFPRGMFDFAAGCLRWYARVSAYALGPSDRPACRRNGNDA